VIHPTEMPCQPDRLHLTFIQLSGEIRHYTRLAHAQPFPQHNLVFAAHH
jgi:hypothetical protein